jgi:hypothetical protein
MHKKREIGNHSTKGAIPCVVGNQALVALHENPLELTLFHFTNSCGSPGLFTAIEVVKFGQLLGPALPERIVVEIAREIDEG